MARAAPAPAADEAVHLGFAATAARRPDAVAVTAGGEHLTYGALAARSARLAGRLRRHGVGVEVVVGLLLGRSVDAAAALLAVLEAGGAYLPLDPGLPPARLAGMVADAGVRVMLTDGAWAPTAAELAPAGAAILRADWDDEEPLSPCRGAPAPAASTAYIIYTSGSTGRPKGVVVSRGALLHSVRTAGSAYRITAGDRVLQFAGLAFDISAEEIFPTLLAGGTVVTVPAAITGSVAEVVALAERERVTVADLPSSFWHGWVAELERGALAPPRLRLVVVGSEAADAGRLQTWQRRVGESVEWLNAYGTTETTFIGTLYRPPAAGDGGAEGTVPIGRPLPGIRVRLGGRRLDAGGAGEIAIGGPSLSRGYLGRPALTAERFVPNPDGDPGERLYLTGDLGRCRGDGVIEFHGRIDDQVKIRGVRVEPEEVASALAADPRLEGAVVVPWDPPAGERVLAAYVVPAGDVGAPGGEAAAALVRELRAELRRRLPEAMVPAVFTILAAFPRNPGGKVERAALPPPAPPEDAGGLAPSTPLEVELAAIWCRVLGRERVGVEEDFFDLGGHSLAGGRMLTRVREAFGVDLPLATLFAARTVADLAAEIAARRRASGPAPPPLLRRGRRRPLPLSFPQESVWFLEQLSPGNLAYNTQISLRLRGPLEVRALAAALAFLVRRHEVLRTSFAPEAPGSPTPVQRVHPPPPVPLPVVDLSGLPAAARRETAERLINAECRRPFAMGGYPLVRWRLLRRAAADHQLTMVEHHFVHDGWSLALVLRELAVLYGAFAAGRPSPLAPLMLHFADFAAWQREWMAGEVLASRLAYWRRRLAGAPPALELPADRPRPPVPSLAGFTRVLVVPPALVADLEALGRRRGASLFMIFLAAFEVLLLRVTGESDLVVGSAVANRWPREAEELVGMLVNPVMLRIDLAGDPPFAEVVRRVRETALEAFAHQDLPFEKLVEALAPKRDASRNPIFQVAFSFHDSPLPPAEWGGAGEGAPLAVEIEYRHNRTAKFDLNVVGIPGAAPGGGLRMEWEAAADLFDAATIERMTGWYRTLLEVVVAAPEGRVSRLPLAAAEAEQVILAAAGEALPLASEDLVHRRFAAQAARRPDALAAAGEDDRLTYGALATRARRLAGRLRAAGVGPDALVGVLLEPGPELAVALTAALAAGGAYLPLDPDHPAERLAYVLADSRVPVLLTRGRPAAALPPGPARPLVLDVGAGAAAAAGETAGEPAVGPANLAYAIYTSGSTGRPKGTLLTHAGLANLAAWHRRQYRLTPADRGTQVASPAFDAAVWEVWPYLAAGAGLHFPPPAVRGEPVRLLAWLAERAITLCFLPTPLAEACLGEPMPRGLSLAVLLTGGDRLHRPPPPGLPFELVNHYGPTECTVVATRAAVPPEPRGARPAIGRPIANLRAEVLEPALGRAPAGVPGHLHLGGVGLARGYLGRPALTAAKFLPDPFAAAPGERLYATGDRVRRRPDGELDFLGRADHQVKLRGFRIELGEIEAVLEEHPAVAQAVVVLRDAGGGEGRLAGYVVPAAAAGDRGRQADGAGAAPPAPPADPVLEAELRRHLAGRLPDYMLPAALVLLAALPLSPTGKIDRRRLPEPAWSAGEATAPRTQTEELVAAIWCRVLGVEEVGVDTDLFSLGGHSLLATRILARVCDATGVQVPMQVFFLRPTVAALAAAVEAAGRQALEQPPAPPLVPGPGGGAPRPGTPSPSAPLSFAQERLWFLDRYGALPGLYNVPEGFHLAGPLDVAVLAASFEAVAARHQVLRATLSTAGGRVRQLFLPRPDLPLPAVDLTRLAGRPAWSAAAGPVMRLAAAEARRPFDLERGPLARAALLRLGDAEHVLLLTLHHVVADGWSMELLRRELAAGYAARRRGRAPPLPPLPVQYADYARWQRRRLTGEVRERQIGWWRRELAGAPPLLTLPADRPRPAVQTFRGADAVLDLPPQLAAAVESVARRSGATLFMTLLAAFQVVLGRSADARDVVVGYPVAGRTRVETEGLVGCFVNTLLVRTDLGGGPTFAEVLGRVRRTVLAADARQDLPFEMLVEALAPDRELSYAPLFQVLFALHPPAAGLDLPGVAATPFVVPTRTSKFDLAFHVEPLGATPAAGLRTLARFNTDLFDRATLVRFARHYRTLLAAAATAPETPAAALPLLAAAERHQFLAEWNDTGATGEDAAAPLHALFSARARSAPDAAALAAAGEALSYGEVRRRVEALAHRLAAAGAAPGRLVGILRERSPAVAVAVLAVLAAGAAYVPLDAGWPAERVRRIVRRHRIGHLLADEAGEAVRALAPLPAPGRVVAADRSAPLEPAAADGGGPLPATGPDDLAYVIFTSGSTGVPKGVAVRHGAAVRLVRWVNRRFAVGPGDRLLWVTSLAFDLSVYDLLGVLAAGGTVRVAATAELADPAELVAILVREAITFWDSAPAALQRLVPFFPQRPAGASLARVFLSGDWVPLTLPGRVRSAFPGARVVALGGATEATVWSNFHVVDAVDPAWASIPYGRPIDGARYHVVDRRCRPVPAGVPGDLLIGGRCLSAGYAGEAAQTAAAYLPDPFGATPGGRLYATGDRARYRADGTLEFLGRTDTQVQLRGFRIELGEVETVLAAHPGVGEAVVLMREDVPGDQRLAAYFVPAAGAAAPTADELRRHAQTRLPDYMVPTGWVEMAGWPLTATGKLDRKALPPPEAAGPAAAKPATADLRPPRTATERAIAGVWREILGVVEVDREASFFDLGGHSLLMARVHERLQEVLGGKLAMVDLFRRPTVAALAGLLEGEAAGERPEVAVAARADEEAAAGPGAGAGTVAVAVVGMAGRFPGAADLGELWRNLRDGVESVRRFSDDELLAAGIAPEELADPAYVKARGALDGADRFDADFFGYSPREAQVLDPQQRLFLETAWAALEDAGYPAGAGTGRVGVFAGSSANRHLAEVLADAALVRAVGPYQVHISNQPDYLPTRVSYELDLAGPSINVQTACSTSLVAVHLACRALAAGDCDLALAGGASVRTAEVAGYLHEAGGILSPDGRTRAFDAGAAGTVSGSGVGVVVLKRLDDALAAGDSVRAVVRGTAVNNDGGRKMGFTAPSADGQAQAVAGALTAAGIDPETVGYVEAHGTATALGDPIEVAGLTQAFRAVGAGRRGYCALGSVKTNLGHLDAAAGVAGLIKAVLALEHRRIPPSLHFETPNPQIDFAASPFYVPGAAADFPALAGAPRRAGVSSFGIGGTNAHAVLEEAPPAPAPAPGRPAELLVLSARTPQALEAASTRLARHLGSRDDLPPLADVAFTLAAGRRAMARRRALVCRGHGEAGAALRRPPARLLAGRAADEEPAVVYLLPGQGTQHPGMAAELYGEEPAFRSCLDRCARILEPHLGSDLRDLLYPPAGAAGAGAEQLAATELAQPALFAVEIALAELWASWGIRPRALLGHSLGELTAACLAGVFRLEDALRLVAARGRLMAAQPPGGMLALRSSEEQVRELLAHERWAEISLAAVNAPRSTVVSGPGEALSAFAEALTGRGVQRRRLTTSHAFHSAAMEPAAEAFAAAVAEVERRPPEIPWVSNVSGRWITAAEATDPAYWGRQLRTTVRFGDGLAALPAASLLLEVGPGRALSALAREHPCRRGAAAAVPSLPPAGGAASDLEALLGALGRLWVAGVEVDWQGVYAGRRRRRVPLPTYPFEGRRFRVGEEVAEAPASAAATATAPSAADERQPRDEVEAALAAIFAEMLGRPEVGRGDDFFDLGGSSLAALQLGHRLRRELAVTLPAGFLLEAPTVAELAAKVRSARGDGEAGPPSCLVRLTAGEGRPLFLVHQVGGQVYTFRALARELGKGQPLYGLRSRGLAAGEEPLTTIGEMAAGYLAAVRDVQPRGPYLLGGASMGGMVAFEMARQLLAAGEELALLCLMDTPCGEQMPAREGHAESVAAALRGRVEIDPAELRPLAPEEQLERAFERARQAAVEIDPGEVRRQVRVIEANAAALYAYEPRSYPGGLLYFRAAERRPGDPPRPELPWIELAAGGAEVVVTPGDHLTMHEPPHVEALARRLAAALELRRDPRALQLLAGRR